MLRSISVGRFLVHRQQIPGTPHILYTITMGGVTVGQQCSRPDKAQCDRIARLARRLHIISPKQYRRLQSRRHVNPPEDRKSLLRQAIDLRETQHT